MSEDQSSALYAAAKAAQDAQPPAPRYTRLTPEERAAQRAEARARYLLGQGLTRLVNGKPCSPTQAPYVGEHIREYEDRIKEMRGQLQGAQADLANERERMDRIVPEWNEVWNALAAQGITLYETTKGHSWEGRANGVEAHGAGYLSIGEALEAALTWRLSLSI